MTHLTDREGNSINGADARAALEDALSAPRFASSPQLSDFLRYVVEETIAGRAAEIKAYSIAVDALGKGEGFDPQDNAAVRVAAGRLRRALALHNATEAANNPPLSITLEAGSYVPVFVSGSADQLVLEQTTSPALLTDESELGTEPAELQSPVELEVERPAVPRLLEEDVTRTASATTPTARSRSLPALAAVAIAVALILGGLLALALWHNQPASVPVAEKAVPLTAADRGLRPGISASVLLPDPSYPPWFNSQELADSLAVIISRFDSYEFFGATSSSDFPASSNHNSDYTLLVSVYETDGKLRVFAKLIRKRDSVVLWSIQRLFTEPKTPAERDLPEIVGLALAPVMSPYGVIYNDLRTSKRSRPALNCFITTYQYFYSKSDERHLRARDCAERLRDEGSRLPSLYAALTFLYLDEYREDRNPRDRNPLEAAAKTAARAVQLGPLNPRAHQAQFAVHKVRGHRDPARKSGRQAVNLNPYDTDIMGDYAAWLISIGDIENGKPLLDRATALLQARPAWLDFYRFLGAELSSELTTANDVSAMMDMSRSPLLAVAVAIGAHRRGEEDETLRALQELRRVAPAMAEDPKAAFLRRGFDESVAQSLTEKLVEAGLNRAGALAN